MKTAIWLCGLLLASGPALHAQDASPDLVEAIGAFLDARGEPEMPDFLHAAADLDDDGRPDAVVLLQGLDWCGSGGCTLLVFHRSEEGLRFVSDSILTRLPVWLAPQKEQGWHSLLVWERDVGEVWMRFDGKAYPGSPAGQPKASAAEIAVSELILFRGPSFNCYVVPEESLEKTICDDRELSRLDEVLAAVYAAAAEAAQGEGAPKLKTEQLAWIAIRDRCRGAGDVPACIQAAYRRRTAELRARYRLAAATE